MTDNICRERRKEDLTYRTCFDCHSPPAVSSALRC